MKFLQGWDSGEGCPFLGCLLAVYSHDLSFVYCPGVGECGGHASAVESLLMRTLMRLEKDPTFITSFNLNCLLIRPISKYSHTGGWGFNPTYAF